MTIALCCNDSFAAYNFRLNFIKALINRGYKLYVICGYDEFTNKLIDEGIEVINVNIEKTSKNIISDLKLYFEIKKVFKKIKPNLIINYTIKPHIYCTLAARKDDIKVINFIAGVGSMFLEDSILRKIIICLYRKSAKYVSKFIFINQTDFNEFKEYKIIKDENAYLVPSEGVDLNKFTYNSDISYETVSFIFVGRLVKEKGLNEYLEAARVIKNRFLDVNFYILGPIYKKHSAVSLQHIYEYEKKGYVKYLGFSYDTNEVYEKMHAVVLPSYREGMPMSLIEGFAKGKVGLASNVPGCQDVIDDNVNGFLFSPKNIDSMVEVISKYINLSVNKKKEMSLSAYQKALRYYDVEKIISKLINIIEME